MAQGQLSSPPGGASLRDSPGVSSASLGGGGLRSVEHCPQPRRVHSGQGRCTSWHWLKRECSKGLLLLFSSFFLRNRTVKIFKNGETIPRAPIPSVLCPCFLLALNAQSWAREERQASRLCSWRTSCLAGWVSVRSARCHLSPQVLRCLCPQTTG